MDITRIPEPLHHLIPWVGIYGINDDGYRDELIYNSDTSDLISMVNEVTEQDIIILNAWLAGPEAEKTPSQEYLLFSSFYLAYDYATALLQSRKH